MGIQRGALEGSRRLRKWICDIRYKPQAPYIWWFHHEACVSIAYEYTIYLLTTFLSLCASEVALFCKPRINDERSSKVPDLWSKTSSYAAYSTERLIAINVTHRPCRVSGLNLWRLQGVDRFCFLRFYTETTRFVSVCLRAGGLLSRLKLTFVSEYTSSIHTTYTSLIQKKIESVVWSACTKDEQSDMGFSSGEGYKPRTSSGQVCLVRWQPAPGIVHPAITMFRTKYSSKQVSILRYTWICICWRWSCHLLPQWLSPAVVHSAISMLRTQWSSKHVSMFRFNHCIRGACACSHLNSTKGPIAALLRLALKPIFDTN